MEGLEGVARPAVAGDWVPEKSHLGGKLRQLHIWKYQNEDFPLLHFDFREAMSLSVANKQQLNSTLPNLDLLPKSKPGRVTAD